jgi:hypothetical protein
VAEKESKEINNTVAENDDGSAVVNFDSDPLAGEQAAAASPSPAAPAAEAKDGGTVAHPDDDDDETLIDQAATDPEREAIRARRREERKRRKEEARLREAQLRGELSNIHRVNQELQQRLALIDRRTTGSELAQIQAAKREAETVRDTLAGYMADAITKQDGKTAAEAGRRQAIAEQRIAELARLEEAYYANLQQQPTAPLQPQPPAAPRRDPTIDSYAAQWQRDHPWFDPARRDADSFLVGSIDQFLAAQGSDPRTAAHWEALSREVRNRLPHRATAAGTNGSSPRVPVGGSGREGGGGGGGKPTSFVLNQQRVQAIKDAGMWDDPKKRAKMTAEYMKYDREHPKQ